MNIYTLNTDTNERQLIHTCKPSEAVAAAEVIADIINSEDGRIDGSPMQAYWYMRADGIDVCYDPE